MDRHVDKGSSGFVTTARAGRPRDGVMFRRRRLRPSLHGEITVPGDKSISHRALIMGAVARGTSRIVGANRGGDVQATARVLSALGVRCEVPDKGLVKIEGLGFDGLGEPGVILDAANSGTTLRTMLGVCAAIEGLSILTGDASLRRRPMLRVVSPLRQMGAAIDGRRHGELPPLAVRGGRLVGADVTLPVASAQVKTALLLAGLRADGETRVAEPGSSRDHTERMLMDAGIEVRRGDGTVAVAGGGVPRPVDRRVPGDVSSAMFLICAALLVPGSDLVIRDVGLNPTRTGALGVLEAMGADLEVAVEDQWNGEPVGTIRARSSSLVGVSPDPAAVPSFVDEIPMLAVAAAFADGETVVTGASELRVKESDRVASVVEGLRTLNVEAEELPDGLVVQGPASPSGGEVASHGDHRIAMAFAVAGLLTPEPVRIGGWSCVETSFPEFLEILGEAQSAR